MNKKKYSSLYHFGAFNNEGLVCKKLLNILKRNKIKSNLYSLNNNEENREFMK